MTKFLSMLAAALLTWGCGASDVEETRLMDAIESQVSLPARAAPLQSYARYYAWENGGDAADATVSAVYMLHEGKPGRYWISREELPTQLDGGCSFISLTYDRSTNRIERIECNTSLNPDHN